MQTEDYIKRSDAVFALCGDCLGTEACGMIGDPCDEVEKIKAIPAADVEPKRKTGQWSVIKGKIRRDIDRRIVRCTLCGNYLGMESVNCGRGDANYCPNCGAKMDGEADNGEL